MARKTKSSSGAASDGASPPRIVGGLFGGRKLLYDHRPDMRPMKQRVREALFNLMGPEVAGKHAVDLFAGTGALGFEALSRSAAGATFIERHFPTAELIRLNVASFAVEDRCEVIAADAFAWVRSLASSSLPARA